jgi:hypothetical protein
MRRIGGGSTKSGSYSGGDREAIMLGLGFTLEGGEIRRRR